MASFVKDKTSTEHVAEKTFKTPLCKYHYIIIEWNKSSLVWNQLKLLLCLSVIANIFLMKIWPSTAFEKMKMRDMDPLIPGMLHGPSARQGLSLFISSKLLLSWCQGGWRFSQLSDHGRGVFTWCIINTNLALAHRLRYCLIDLNWTLMI